MRLIVYLLIPITGLIAVSLACTRKDALNSFNRGLELHPLNLIWEREGDVQRDNFGNSVAFVGRYNQDGYDDIAVGAPTTGWGAAGKGGKAYVFSGADQTALLSVVNTEGTGEGNMGIFVDRVGDYNGDGWSDIYIGKSADAFPAGNNNWAQIYSWDSGNNTRILSKGTVIPGDSYAFAAAVIGQTTGHATPDIVIGAAAILSESHFYVYNYDGGANTLEWSQVQESAVADAKDGLGWSVTGLGDYNGDGYDDFAVGAVNYPPTNTGKVYIYSGRDRSILWEQVGENLQDQYGWSVSSPGDLNGDGRNELIVGSSAYDTEDLTNAGKIYVYSWQQGENKLIFRKRVNTLTHFLEEIRQRQETLMVTVEPILSSAPKAMRSYLAKYIFTQASIFLYMPPKKVKT